MGTGLCLIPGEVDIMYNVAPPIAASLPGSCMLAIPNLDTGLNDWSS